MPTSLPCLRARYWRDRTALWQPLLDTGSDNGRQGSATRGIQRRLRQFSELTDHLLRQLWQRAAKAGKKCSGTAALDGLALVAVGGYGRAQLFPCSDIDVLVLLPDDVPCPAAQQSAMERFIHHGWDAGLHISSSVRTLSQCLQDAAVDLSTQTSLLEARLVCGDSALFAQLQQRCAAQMQPHTFLQAKMLEMHQRHTRWDNSPYALEANCKDSPGGLRDLQLVLWIARAAGLGHTWAALVANGLATPLEARQLEHDEALLCLIRARLHLLAGRSEDRLLFDLQTAVAATFGWRTHTPAASGGTAAPKPGHKHPSELLMRRYYWSAKAVSQLTRILLLCLQERLNPRPHTLRPINARFHEKAGLLEVASDDLYQRHPHAILETFVLYQSHIGIKDLSARTLRALYHARTMMDSGFRRDPVNRANFMQILRQHSRVTHALQLMNQTSVLGRTLWPFRRIVGQMQHDLFHVYTVDQHSLMVLRNMRRFFLPEHAHEYPLCSQLAANWNAPWLLYLAALFHDIGKGHGGDHSVIGALIARRFCRQHAPWGISEDDAQLIEWLVAEHLSLSHVAQKHDLSDPGVIAAFARHVGTERRLTALYLLTVADIRGTSAKVWSAWKGKLLQDLYHATLRVLGGHHHDLGAEIEMRKQQALALLYVPCPASGAGRQATPARHIALWNTLHISYFMRHDAGDIAWHTQHLWHCPGSADAIVRARPSLTGEGLQVMVYAPDQPELFARICGWFDQAGFSILNARIHTTSTGHALDTFDTVTPHWPAGHEQELMEQAQSHLPHAIATAAPLPAPVRSSLSRRAKSFPVTPHISLRPDEGRQRWLLSLSAGDRAGLLYRIACVLARHGLNVELAKISTLGERVEDTFLLQGTELQDDAAQIRLETELLHLLAADHT